MTIDRLERYRRALEPLPDAQWVWPLYGAGLESLGREGRPVRVPLPPYGPDEILVRYDAVGLCYSDLKVIKAGQSHPRIRDDMRRKPVILGHEIALTVVGVGARRQNSFHIGDRFTVQPLVSYQGRDLAIGYSLPGGLAQYGVMGREVLDSDEGCCLLPLAPEEGYAGAALAEPWACVEAAYAIEYRRGLKPGGAAWFAGAPTSWGFQIAERFTIDARSHPRLVALSDVPANLKDRLHAQAAALGITLVAADGLSPDAYPQAAALAGVEAFDDILLLGPHRSASIAAALALLAPEGALIVASREPLPEPVTLDVGRLHYDRLLLGGTREPDVSAGYRAIDCELPPGGTLWVIGGGGPMGQMHIQRALQLSSRRPRRVIVSDVRADRLAVVQRRLGPLARRRRVDLLYLAELDPTAEIIKLTKGRGVDYIVVLAPDARVITQAYPLLAPGGVLNIFAGLPHSSPAVVDLNGVLDGRQLRLIGSSGSTIADLHRVLVKSRDGFLYPEQAVAAVTGLGGVRDALLGMEAQRFPGKVVVYPQLMDLPLITLEEMSAAMPAVSAHLGEGSVWTNEAEKALLRTCLAD